MLSSFTQHLFQQLLIFAMAGGYLVYTIEQYQNGTEPSLGYYGMIAMALFWGSAIVVTIFRAYPVGTVSSDSSIIGYREVQEGRDGSGGES